MEYVLGEGILNWFRSERICDRYGTIHLCAGPKDHNIFGSLLVETHSLPLCKDADGVHGILFADIKETRDSAHIGDLFHGVGPVTPEVGETIKLGEGTLFFEEEDTPEGMTFKAGVRPDDGRKTLWMDIEALYRCHEQTVRLYFVPG